jgi:hypothetical protein
MENNNKILSRFENEGSVKYYKEFNRKFEKARSTFIMLIGVFAGAIIISVILNYISLILGILLLIICSSIIIGFSKILNIIWLNNTYTLAKNGALEDEIKKL